jgi:hypothetical protein
MGESEEWQVPELVLFARYNYSSILIKKLIVSFVKLVLIDTEF